MAYATSTYLLIATIASAVVAAGGTAVSADASRRAANTNADIQEQNAAAARAKASYDEQRHRESVQKMLSTQRALYGKSGVDMAGSPLLVMEDTAAQGELDALAIRYGGDVASAQQRSQANLSRMQASDYQTAGYIKAGSSLLSGASDTAIGYNKITKGVTDSRVVVRSQ